ncbi:MAG: heme A synthase, partial [Alphaproteobacteria bacterium]|nr:heme A synthase [Alphaproteobacteria bacterium]
NIFFWEWVHRLWGRLIGLVYALPLIYFTLTKKIPRPFLLRCWLILLLGAAQGFVGWFMVQSGLVDATTVSPYRLALHLSLALVLLGAVLWTAWDISHNAAAHEKLSFCMKRHGVVALAFLAITIVWGAFVAGMDAGKMYNTWPLMEGEFLPAVAISANPWWKNFFANAVAIQFAHRWLGILTGVMILSWAVRLYAQAPRGRNKKYAINLALLAIIQPLLGILTLLHAVPVWLGTLHQGVAAVLLSYLLFQLHPVSRMHKI